MNDLLDQVQRLQFSDKAAAEALLGVFVAERFPQLAVERLELRPLAVSLNSFNGYLHLRDGQKLFFKTHIENDGVLGEYYQAEVLTAARYRILQPVWESRTAGQQLLIYPYVDAPSVFDVAWQIEQGDVSERDGLATAQGALDDALFEIYARTLEWQQAREASGAAIHQLFFHRLTGGRLDRFYGSQEAGVQVGGQWLPMVHLRRLHWMINGRHYDESLDDCIGRAVVLLEPTQAGPSIVGHGDAHNGNVFYHKLGDGSAELSYFDPAFAGRHHPLLDLTKPLFHNVFCMWMYHAQIKASQTHVTVALDGDTLIVEHDYALHPIRTMFLQSKIQRVLVPILRLLKARGWLNEDWRPYLKSALFCCPFLTKNLIDRGTFPPSISILGLSQAMEMGSVAVEKGSLIDSVLDEVEAAIRS